MGIYEVISILEDRYLPEEIVEMLDNIEKEDIKDYAVKNMICPKCYGELVERRWEEDRGECFGKPVIEEISEVLCENCGWVNE